MGMTYMSLEWSLLMNSKFLNEIYMLSSKLTLFGIRGEKSKFQEGHYLEDFKCSKERDF